MSRVMNFSERYFARESRVIKIAALFAWRLMLTKSTVSPGAW
ncbi:MAG: hypothetical protein RL209_533, partial [Pseudomonadota bacterium]